MNSLFGKIFGWLQFATATAGQVAQGGAPHGFWQWLTLISSLSAAVGIHAASNVGQVVSQPGNSTTPATGAHIVQ